MSYIQPRGRKRKLKIFRVFLLIAVVISLGIASVWTYNTFFKKAPVVIEEPDPVVVEMEDLISREIFVITNPFDYVNNRFESVIINDKEIDLIDLYNHYGILYYLAEPITEEEINAQFLDIYLFLKPIYKEMISRDYSVEKRIDMFGHVYDNPDQYKQVMGDFALGLMAFADARYADADPMFTKFDRSFIYDDIREYVMYKEPRSVFMRMQDKDAFITRYDRQIYVRMFKVITIMFQDIYAKYGISYKCTMCPIVEEE
jgi:hypothetical protein